jgi:hypothetical protein
LKRVLAEGEDTDTEATKSDDADVQDGSEDKESPA